MGNIDQLLCTHCTYGTSFLHQSKTHLKDQVFEYSARTGSIEPAQSHDLFRRIEPFLNYRLPTDAPHTALVEHNARSLPKRLVYLPAANGVRLVSQVSYRTYDVTKRRAGAYFAHVLLQMTGDTPRGPQGRPLPPPPPRAKIEPKPKMEWSARDAAQMWGWPQWIEEDDPEPNPKSFQEVSKPFSNLPTPEFETETWQKLDPAQRIGDEALSAFLLVDADKQPSWIPQRWQNVPAKVRQQLLIELLHGFLKLNVEARECFLIGIEPALAALLFFGVARLLPRRGPAEQLSFSTCEPQNLRPPFALAATHSYLGTPITLADDPRVCTLALSTFQSGWETTRTARNQGLTQASYAQAIVNVYVNSGPAAVDCFLQPIDDETIHPQPPTANDLAELLAAEAYGQWIIGAGPPPAKPTPPTSKTGKRHVASIVHAAMSALQGDRLQNHAHWRPLLQILAENDETLGATGSPAEEHQRKRLVAEILTRIVNRQSEAEDCLKPSALPNEWQAQLMVQLIQGGKSLPASVDDFWKGRFADARSGRQKWLSIVADRLAAQDGAEGLDRLLQRYESWLKAQPELAANLAPAQSRASVLQMLCEVADKHPAVGASARLQALVNQFLEKNARWHDELLNRVHWSTGQTRTLLEKYVDREYQVAGLTVAESPLAVRVLRDLNDFPCPPYGEKTAPNSESWLEFLETAEAALQLRRGKQISAWKHLRNLLGDLAAHWAAMPSGLQARFGTTEWQAGIHELGEKISQAMRTATQLEHCSDDKTNAAWERLKRLQELVNPSFKWSTRNADDPLAARFCKEVRRTMRELGQWDARHVRMETPRRSWTPPINLKWIGIASAVVILIPILVTVVKSWPKSTPAPDVVKTPVVPATHVSSLPKTPAPLPSKDSPEPDAGTKTEVAQNPGMSNNTPKLDPAPTKTDGGNQDGADEELTKAEQQMLKQLRTPGHPHLIHLTRRLIRENRETFISNFDDVVLPGGFASLPSVRWTILSDGPMGTPQEQLNAMTKTGAKEERLKKLLAEGLGKLLIQNPEVAKAVAEAIKAISNPDAGKIDYLASAFLQELPPQLRSELDASRKSREADSAQKRKFDQLLVNAIYDTCKSDTKPDRLKKVFDDPRGDEFSSVESLREVTGCAIEAIQKIAAEITKTERVRLEELVKVRRNLFATPPTQFVDLPAGKPVEVTCPFHIDGICIHGLDQVTSHIKERWSESAQLNGPFWEKDAQGRWSVVVIYNSSQVLAVTPDNSNSTHVTISTANTILPHEYLQMLVVEVSGRLAVDTTADAAPVQWLALYKPVPLAVDVVDGLPKSNTLVKPEPHPLREFLCLESVWGGRQELDVRVGSKPLRRVARMVLPASDKDRTGGLPAWNVDGIYPSRYDATKGESSDEKLQKHPLIMRYQEDLKTYKDAPPEKKPLVPEPPLTPALDLLSRGTARIVLVETAHLLLILGKTWSQHPFVIERTILQAEYDPKKNNGKPAGQLVNLQKEYSKNHAKPESENQLKSAEDYLQGFASNPQIVVRCIESLGNAKAGSLTQPREKKEAWLQRVKKGESTQAWLVRVKKDIQTRIDSVEIELEAVKSALDEAKESRDSLKVSCHVSGYRQLLDPQENGQKIHIPLTESSGK